MRRILFIFLAGLQWGCKKDGIDSCLTSLEQKLLQWETVLASRPPTSRQMVEIQLDITVLDFDSSRIEETCGALGVAERARLRKAKSRYHRLFNPPASGFANTQ